MKHLFFLLVAVVSASAAESAETVTSPLPDLTILSGAETFQGKGTDAHFPYLVTIEHSATRRVLRAVGSGVRKKLVFKGYEAVAYVERGADLGDDPYTAVVEGDFAKRILMFFLRNVGGGKIRGAFRGGMENVLGKDEWPEAVAEDFETFLTYISDDGVKNGEAIDLTWLPGLGLFTAVGAQAFPPIENPELARALWATWLGENPMSKDLKRDMLRFVLEEDD